MTAPTTGTEDDARDEIGRLAQKIEDEVPEELWDRARGPVLTALYDVPRDSSNWCRNTEGRTTRSRRLPDGHEL
jgi:hypothetical protein